MSEEESDWLTDLWDQLSLHWKKVAIVIVAALVAGTIWSWRKVGANEAELAASHAVWQMQFSNTVAAPQWERTASVHDGTRAAARALLLAAESYFLEAQRGLAVVSRDETTAVESRNASTRTLEEAREEIAELKKTWDDLKETLDKADMKVKTLEKNPTVSKEEKGKAAQDAVDAKKEAEEAKASHDTALVDRLEVAKRQLEQSEQEIKSARDSRKDAEVAAKSAFTSARLRFDQFLVNYGDNHPFSGTAWLGKAACLDELSDSGVKDAYLKVLNSFEQEMVAIQARLALAVLYEEEGKFKDAKNLLDDVEKADISQFWGRQAQVLRGRLLDRHPELNAKATTATNGTTLLPVPSGGTNKPSTNSLPKPSNKPPTK